MPPSQIQRQRKPDRQKGARRWAARVDEQPRCGEWGGGAQGIASDAGGRARGEKWLSGETGGALTDFPGEREC